MLPPCSGAEWCAGSQLQPHLGAAQGHGQGGVGGGQQNHAPSFMELAFPSQHRLLLIGPGKGGDDPGKTPVRDTHAGHIGTGGIGIRQIPHGHETAFHQVAYKTATAAEGIADWPTSMAEMVTFRVSPACAPSM